VEGEEGEEEEKKEGSQQKSIGQKEGEKNKIYISPVLLRMNRRGNILLDLKPVPGCYKYSPSPDGSVPIRNLACAALSMIERQQAGKGAHQIRDYHYPNRAIALG
jgi:hypothetical protein